MESAALRIRGREGQALAAAVSGFPMPRKGWCGRSVMSSSEVGELGRRHMASRSFFWHAQDGKGTGSSDSVPPAPDGAECVWIVSKGGAVGRVWGL
jgi:hypothetical protein